MGLRSVLALMVMLILVSAQPAGPPSSEPENTADADGWSGTYTLAGGHDFPQFRTSRQITLRKEGEHYRIDLKPYEEFTFVEVQPGVLESRTLGRICRGEARFEGGLTGPTPVLLATFCYEHFYLLGTPAPPQPAKDDSRK